MAIRNRISAAIGVIAIVFYFGVAPGHAADGFRSFDSGQPRELINRPVCWTSEQPDEPHFCDYAQRL